MSYAITTTVEAPYPAVLDQVRRALNDQGFGILTEIDIKATMKAKMDADVAPQMILGACNPGLALAALQAEPSIGLLLPCNVVVRAIGEHTTMVEALDPHTMVSITMNPDLQVIADDAAERLRAALVALSPAPTQAR